jgi:hypothetical protein
MKSSAQNSLEINRWPRYRTLPHGQDVPIEGGPDNRELPYREPWMNRREIMGVLALVICTALIALVLPSPPAFDFWIGMGAYTIALLAVIAWLS